MKCKHCKRFAHFIDYDGAKAMTLHFVCVQNVIDGYMLLPFFKKILFNNDTRQRISKVKHCMLWSTSLVFVLLGGLIFCNLWGLVIFIASLWIMWSYVFFQLYLSEMNNIHIFEFSFNNYSFNNLSNMGIGNKNSRMIEVCQRPSFDEIKRRIKFVPILYLLYVIPVTLWVLLIANYRRCRIIERYVFTDIMELAFDGIGNVRCYGDFIVDEIKSIEKSLTKMDLSIIKVVKKQIDTYESKVK